MKITVEIDEKELKTLVTDLIAKRLVSDWSYEKNVSRYAIADAVREVAYSQKEEIINKCVNRASAEIVRKAMPKLVGKMLE